MGLRLKYSNILQNLIIYENMEKHVRSWFSGNRIMENHVRAWFQGLYKSAKVLVTRALRVRYKT
jgi:hypothetical protein